MAKGYWIAHLTVVDPDRYKEYARKAGPFLMGRGARILVIGGAYEAVEGETRPRNLIVEFESYAAARDTYHSPEYAEIRKLREGATEGDLMIVEGFGG